MPSIKNKLIKYITFVNSLMFLIIFVTTDIIVDTWVINEFDKTLTDKTHYLISLVREDYNEVEFGFSAQFMPEFSGLKNLEYFQLWSEGITVEKSKTLTLFSQKELPFQTLAENEAKIIDLILPDGRSGRMHLTRFSKYQKPMYLAYATTTDNLENKLLFIDLSFLLTTIFSIFSLRWIIIKIINHGLHPLNELNKKLREVDITSQSGQLSLVNTPEELVSIVTELNLFIVENIKHYAREQRITSNIAHELKTPITELINLSEVAIKFPFNQEISSSFKPDILRIAIRMKNIVANILLLQKSNNTEYLPKELIDCNHFVFSIIAQFEHQEKLINVECSHQLIDLYINKFALETILNNLIKNAIYYSPAHSEISVFVEQLTGEKQVRISVSNMLTQQISTDELEHFFEPLWQLDKSRTSSEHFGLGLAIVKSFCQAIGVSITIDLPRENYIKFSIDL